MTWFTLARCPLCLPTLFALAIAASFLLAACGGEGEGPPPTPKTTERVTADDLPAMLLAADDLPEQLAGFSATETTRFPIEGFASGGEPVEVDGYRIDLWRETEGADNDAIGIEVHLTETETLAHGFFTFWYAEDPNGCLDFGGESDCYFMPVEEDRGLASASFRTGRIVGSVAVAMSGEQQSELEDAAQHLARMLFEKIQEQL